MPTCAKAHPPRDHRYFAAIMTACVLVSSAPLQRAVGQDMMLRPGRQDVMLRVPGDTVRLGSGRISSGDSQPEMFTLRRAPGANIAALTVQARMRPVRSPLLALSVFEQREGVPFGAPLCQAEGTGPLVACRAIVVDESAHSLVVMVGPAGGRGSNDYSLQAIPVAGPLIRGTSLSVADARVLGVDHTFGDSLGFGSVDRGGAALYRVTLPPDAPDSVYVSLTPSDRHSLRLNVFDQQGRVLEEFAPTDAFAQQRLSRAGARSLLLLVQPANDRDYPMLTRFSVRVGASPTAVQALAPDGESSWSGTGAQQFDLRVPAGWSGVIALGGRGQRLRVTDSSGKAWPLESAFGGTTLGVRVGESWLGSSFVRRGLSSSTRLTIDVSADPSQRYHSDWALSVRGKRGSGISLVAFPMAASEAWPTIWQVDARTVNMSGGVRALMIPAPPDQFRSHTVPMKQSRAPEGGFRFGVRLAGGADRFYDIAVTDEWGDAIDIADAGVYWQWPGDRERLAIVVFAQPGIPTADLPTSVQLTIQSPARPPSAVAPMKRALPAAAAVVTRPRPKPQAPAPRVTPR